VVLEGLEIGEHTAILRTFLSEDTTVQVTLSVNFTVAIEDGTPVGNDPDGRSYLWLLLLLPLLLVALIPIVLLLFRKKDDANWEE